MSNTYKIAIEEGANIIRIVHSCLVSVNKKKRRILTREPELHSDAKLRKGA